MRRNEPLADLGLPDAEELTAKTIMAKKINDTLESRGLIATRLILHTLPPHYVIPAEEPVNESKFGCDMDRL